MAAVSGSIGQTTFETRRVIDGAFRRCRLPAQAITSEMIDDAKDQLFLMLSSMQAQFLPLWAQERRVLGLTEGEMALDTPVGTIDVISASLRTLARLTGTDTSAAASVTTDLGSSAIVASVGFRLSAAGTFTLVIESSDDGVAYTPHASLPATAYAANAWTWTDFDPTISARYWRLRETTGATIAVDEFYLGGSPSEIIMGRTSLDTYASLPDRTTRGRPTQYFVDRQYERPRIVLWPAPDTTNALSQVVIWRQRHIMDVGTLTQRLEIPARWFDAIVAGLAYRMAVETPQVDASLVPLLKGMADEAMLLMGANEKDASPMVMRFGFGGYTR
jgi:hypothetical protein